MSLPSSGPWPPRRRSRASSAAHAGHGHLNGRSSLVGDEGMANSISGSGIGYGSFRTSHEPFMISPSAPLTHREPTRSFYHSSFRGTPAPIDSAQNARNVREDTAELASYALSDQASSIISTSPSQRPGSGNQSQIDTYFNRDSSQYEDSDDVTTSHASDALRPAVIHEVSEPVSPEMEHSSFRSNSALTDMLRRSPSSTSPPRTNQSNGRIARIPLPATTDNDTEVAVIDDVDDGMSIDGAKYALSPDEETPLVPKRGSIQHHPDYIHGEDDLEAQDMRRNKSWPKLQSLAKWPLKKGRRAVQVVSSPKSWDHKVILQKAVYEPAGLLPAVILGCLLNILDALSYGMILFPLGAPIFESLGPAGISMFYVSCIVSQLTYSCGGSIFKGGIGSEMIEVVPFFHKMAFTITALVGEENPEAVIATTITAYALSSIMTGVVFFLMGFFRIGKFVGFIPRHILIGCIGGVGWFLIATGLEVTARLDGNLEYDLATLKQLVRSDTILLWTIPLILAITLYIMQQYNKSKYLVPTYILAIPAIFYFFVFSVSSAHTSFASGGLRDAGWMFDAPPADEPWWYFYTLYKFKLVHWGAIAETIPAMLALTFFGILHVPINVPALAFSIHEDNADIDRELVAHGVSNALSGAFGSIQNYLVYTNSVMFIRSGGGTRLAGIMLAAATFAVMLVGPIIIGYIPVMMVGVLIFDLGLELFIEAIWLPRKKLKWLEYGTVVAIVLIMGVYDFVVGIFVGIGLAFLSLVVQTSRVPAVRASFTGEIAGSTVRRAPTQHAYLRQAGRQIHVTKLAGYLFFGTIVSVEDRIRCLLEESAFNERPIRYLLFDLWHVTGLDYSAAEAFGRINRLFSKKGVTIVMSGLDTNGPIVKSFQSVNIAEDSNEVQYFEDLNSALEYCENDLLKAFYHNKEGRLSRTAATLSVDVPQGPSHTRSHSHSIDVQFSSPRHNHLLQSARQAIKDNDSAGPRWQNFKEPLRLILQTFHGLTEKNEDFWFRVTKYFQRREITAGEVLYSVGEPAGGFYLLETGILRAEYDLPQGKYYESIVAGTTCGELPFFSETDRTATVQAERDCISWVMNRQGWEELQKEEPDIARELLRISLKLTSERFSSITSYVLTTAG